MRSKPDGASHFQALLAGFAEAGIKDHVIRDLSGVSTTTLWRGRSGEMRQPQYETVRAVENAYVRLVGPFPTGKRR